MGHSKINQNLIFKRIFKKGILKKRDALHFLWCRFFLCWSISTLLSLPYCILKPCVHKGFQRKKGRISKKIAKIVSKVKLQRYLFVYATQNLHGKQFFLECYFLSCSGLFYWAINYTNSLLIADSFYANFTNVNFQKIAIPHLTRPMKDKLFH